MSGELSIEQKLEIIERHYRYALDLLGEYGWVQFGVHADDPSGPPLQFWGEGRDGMPIFERVMP